MDEWTVSCIVPVYNGERYLAEALDSILAQTRRPAEIIVMDDGSTDGTPALAARYGSLIRYVRQDNAGAAAARNHGVRLAKGELVAFLDADDLYHASKLVRQIAGFVERPELEFCESHAQDFWSPELPPAEERSEDAAPVRPPRLGQVGSWLVRRSLFARVGLFDERLAFAEATDWYLRVRDAGVAVATLPEVLLFRRIHLANNTRRHRHSNLEFILGLAKNRLARRRTPLSPATPCSTQSPADLARDRGVRG